MSNNYYKTNETIISDFSEENITSQYNNGFVFTRLGKGEMIQTRSLRIDLSKFELSSENRRILNKNENLKLEVENLPLGNYNWSIHKLGKEFYSTKFGDQTMSAAKIKEMFQEQEKSNMNNVLVYSIEQKSIGYCLIYLNAEILHYGYPFYDLTLDQSNLGIGMMTKAIVWAKENSKEYIYLGSVVDSKAKYKLQFSGLEWFNEKEMIWSEDIEALKLLITN